MADRPNPRPFARNVLANWGAFVVAAGLSFVVSPIVVRTLGDTGYGTWALLTSVVGYLGLLDLGVRGAVTQHVARFHSVGDHARASLTTSAALRVFAATGLCAIGFGVALALLADRLFNIPPEMVAAARVVAVVGSLSIAVSLVGGVFGGVVIGLQRFDYHNGLEMANGVLRAVAIVAALRLGGGIVALALVQLGASVIRAGGDVWLSRRLYPQLAVGLVSDREHVRMVLSFGLASFVLNVSTLIMLYSDSVVIGAFLPVGVVTYFAIAANLTDYGRQVVSGISRVLTPLTSSLQARGEASALGRAVLDSARITSLLILPIVITFILRGASFIDLWIGVNYGTVAGPVLAVLAVVLGVSASYQVSTAAIMGVNRHATLIPTFLIELVCNLALSIYWVQSLGILGCALGTLVPRLGVTLLAGPWFVRRTFGVPLGQYWLNAHVRPLVAIVPFALATYAIERWWTAGSLLSYFAQVALALPCAALGAWFVALKADERAWVRVRLGRLAPRTSSAA